MKWPWVSRKRLERERAGRLAERASLEARAAAANQRATNARREALNGPLMEVAKGLDRIQAEIHMKFNARGALGILLTRTQYGELEEAVRAADMYFGHTKWHHESLAYRMYVLGVPVTLTDDGQACILLEPGE